MNQKKTGEFIALMRKEHSLTQRQLAEKLGISDKTVSKWETGKGMPEVSLMLPLCEILNISANELLSGERLTGINYHEKAEENIMQLMKEQESGRKKTFVSFFVVINIINVALFLAVYSVAETSHVMEYAIIFVLILLQYVIANTFNLIIYMLRGEVIEE